MGKEFISIKDIAESCGVSAMTVSRALRQSSSVHPDTLSKILAKAEELGYFKSSRLGRPCRRNMCNRQYRIQLVLGSSDSSVSIFHSRLVNFIQRDLVGHDCECVLYSNDGNFSGFLILLEALKRHPSDAVIIIGDFPQEQLKTLLMSFPGAILLDNPGVEEFDATFSSFNFDNKAAVELMLCHLLESGRKKVVLLCGREDHFFSQAMKESYVETLQRYGLPYDENLVLFSDFSAMSAAEEMEKFLGSGIEFDAVLSNDEMALGVYRVLLSSGIKIPDEVAVGGCDNLPLGKMLYPALSTVDLDYRKLADAAVEFILNGEKNIVPRRILFSPELLVRESTCK